MAGKTAGKPAKTGRKERRTFKSPRRRSAGGARRTTKTGKRRVFEQSSVRGFMAVAEKYCDLIEHSQDYLRIDFLRGCAELLPELYVAALRLPDAEGDSRLINQRGRFHNASGKQRRDLEWAAYCGAYIDTEEWKRVYDSLSEKLGDRRWYWQVFDPYADKDSIRGDLAGDLADIWRDAKQGLICFRKGGLRHKEQAVFDWRFQVMWHWGDHHFASAMAAIHSVLRDAYLE